MKWRDIGDSTPKLNIEEVLRICFQEEEKVTQILHLRSYNSGNSVKAKHFDHSLHLYFGILENNDQ